MLMMAVMLESDGDLGAMILAIYVAKFSTSPLYLTIMTDEERAGSPYS
jgi:hypothetical protein